MTHELQSSMRSAVALILAGVAGFCLQLPIADAHEQPAPHNQTGGPGLGDAATSAPPTPGTPAADDRPPSRPPRFVLPEGFEIELVAGPPLVRYPLFACFDDVGRLYVAEGTGLSVPGEQLVSLGLGRITRLEDTDGDGVFDTSTLFADDLVFPQGVLWHNGVVYVASHPAIWRLEDTDNDGRADQREEFLARFNFNGNGCDIHGPILGPDGRLYWTDGRHGYRIERPDGTVLEGFASRIWRCRTDGNELERIAGGGFDNPVELAWTEDGELLGTMDQGAGDCLLHYVEGGVYPEDHPCIREFARTGPLMGVAKRYSVELPAALCGTMRYRSSGFGPEFQDALITTHYMTHKLVRSALIREGATFRAEDTDFLVSADPHLRLTDVLQDADGSLLVTDMGAWYSYGFLGNVLPRPEMLGAIYRIRRSDQQRLADPRGQELRLSERSAEELAGLLDDPRPVVRDRVIDRLGTLGGAAVPALESVLRSADQSVDARCGAVWALCRIDAAEARAAIRGGVLSLADSQRQRGDHRVDSSRGDSDASHVALMVAVQAAGLHRDAAARNVLAELLERNDPSLQRKAAEALGRIGNPDSVPGLLDTLRRPADRFLEHSVIYALIQINDPAAVEPRLLDSHPAVRQAALIALDQMPRGRLTRAQVERLLDTNDTTLQHAALSIISRRPEWAGAAHNILRAWLASPRLTAEQQQSLSALLSGGSDDPVVQQMAGSALASHATASATRTLLIGVIRQSQRETLPEAWASGLSEALATGDSVLRWDALDAVRTRGWRQFDQTVTELSRDERLTPDLRVAALECLSASRQPLDDATFTFLADQLSESTAPLLRLAVARTLAASTLGKEQLTRIAERTRQESTMILRLLLPLFARTSDGDVGAVLVDSLMAAPAAEALTAAELDIVLKEFPAHVRQHAAPLREKLVLRQSDQAAYLARLTAELDQLQGDPDAGKEVFMAPKNNCFACHRAVGRGGQIGPELSKIGQFRTRAELLESIIFPSLVIAPQYQTHTVVTREGRVATGLVVRETADAVSLRMTDLAELRIARSSVEELTPSAVSIMPDGLEKNLSRQQLVDLLEFLCQQR